MFKDISKSLLLIALAISPIEALSGDINNKIGPWKIQYYSNDSAADVGAPCAAIQYANGADLMVTINPEEPNDKNSLVLFTSFEKPYKDARVWIDDGMRFDHYLENYWPQRHGHSGVYKVSDFKGDKLFVRFEIGHVDVGRYEFIFGSMASLSSYLHQKKCMFKDSAPVKAISKAEYDQIEIGQNMVRVRSILKIDEDDAEFSGDEKNMFITWKNAFGGNWIVIEINVATDTVVSKKLVHKSKKN
jgi:hypothetical protein